VVGVHPGEPHSLNPIKICRGFVEISTAPTAGVEMIMHDDDDDDDDDVMMNPPHPILSFPRF